MKFRIGDRVIVLKSADKRLPEGSEVTVSGFVDTGATIEVYEIEDRSGESWYCLSHQIQKNNRSTICTNQKPGSITLH